MIEVNDLVNNLRKWLNSIQYKEEKQAISDFNLSQLKYNLCNHSKDILKEDFMMYEFNGITYIGIGKMLEFKVINKEVVIKNHKEDLEIVESYESLPEILEEIYLVFKEFSLKTFGYINFNLAKYLYLSIHGCKDDELIYFFIPSVTVKISDGNMLVQYLEENPFINLVEINKKINLKHLPLMYDTEEILLNQNSEIYKSNVEKAVGDIKTKLYSKVILSRKIIISERINMLRSYFSGLKINNPARSYLFDINGKELFGFSPETIVQVNNENQVLTFPLAGTRKNKEYLKKELLTDIKEVGEHAVSVKLATEELKNVCKTDTIKVDEFMKIYERGSVQHLGSVVSGKLYKSNYWDALLSLYPAVTSSGIPKKESIQAIEKYENDERDLYSGGVFLIDKDIGFDVALILRTVFQNENETYARAGAGIVEQSLPERELEETREKLSSVIKSLSL